MKYFSYGATLVWMVACKRDQAVGDRLTDIVELHLGNSYSCAVDSKRAAYCWGASEPAPAERSGGLLQSSPTSRPRRIAGTDGAETYFVGDGSGIAKMPDGKIVSWPFRNLKVDPESKESPPPGPEGVDPSTLDAWHAYATGLETSGRLFDRAFVFCFYEGEMLKCWEGGEGGLPDWQRGENWRLPGLINVVRVAPDDNDRLAVCMLFDDGRVDCARDGMTETLALDARVTRMVAGYTHLGMLLEDGRLAIAACDLKPVVETRVGRVIDLDISDRICVATDAHDVLCWWGPHCSGRDLGELGEPTRVDGLDRPTRVAVDSAHACALEADGSVRCWGANSHGECGVGFVSEMVATPTYVVAPSEEPHHGR